MLVCVFLVVARNFFHESLYEIHECKIFLPGKKRSTVPYGPNEAINALEEQMKAKSDDELR